jgi:ABC-type branched-subunit amino acid transport system substrate-binding protein
MIRRKALAACAVAALTTLTACAGRGTKEITASDSRPVGTERPELVVEADIAETTSTVPIDVVVETTTAPTTRASTTAAPTTAVSTTKPTTTVAPVVVTVTVTVPVPVPVPVPAPVPTAAPPTRPTTTATPTTQATTTQATTQATTTSVPTSTAPSVETTVVASSRPAKTTKAPRPPKSTTTTTVPVRPKTGATCTKSQRNTSKIRSDASSVTCLLDAKKVWVWTEIAAPTTVAVAAPTMQPTAGFDGKTIRVGVLSTTTNPTWGQIGKSINAGIEARVSAINRKGGIAGRYKIELVNADTNYDPNQTLAKLQETQAGVVGYLSVLGTPNVEAIDPTLRSLQILAGPASQEARWAAAPNLLPIANSYQVQAINGISYFLETSGNPKATICALAVATSFGEAGNEGVRFAQSKLGFTPGPISILSPADTNVAPALLAMKAAGCAAVMLTTTPQQTAAAVVTGRAIGFAPRWIIIGASFSDRIVVPQTGPLFEQGAWVVADGTQWGDPAVPGMAQLASELIASNNRYWTENPDTGLTYGWLQAKVFESVLERAVVRGDLTHAGLVAASREIGVVDSAGLASNIDYSSPLRLANARTTIFNVDGSYRNAVKVLSLAYTSPAAQAYRPA